MNIFETPFGGMTGGMASWGKSPGDMENFACGL